MVQYLRQDVSENGSVQTAHLEDGGKHTGLLSAGAAGLSSSTGYSPDTNLTTGAAQVPGAVTIVASHPAERRPRHCRKRDAARHWSAPVVQWAEALPPVLCDQALGGWRGAGCALHCCCVAKRLRRGAGSRLRRSSGVAALDCRCRSWWIIGTCLHNQMATKAYKVPPWSTTFQKCRKTWQEQQALQAHDCHGMTQPVQAFGHTIACADYFRSIMWPTV